MPRFLFLFTCIVVVCVTGVALSHAASKVDLSIVIHPGTVAIGIVDESGQVQDEIPTVTLAPVTASAVQSSYAGRVDEQPSEEVETILGNKEEQQDLQMLEGTLDNSFRIGNATEAKNLSVTLAPQGGEGAVWTNDQGETLDIASVLAGQLGVSLLFGVEAVQSSGDTKVSIGQESQFESGVTDSITLMNIQEGFEEYDVQGLKFTQTLPEDRQLDETYSLELMMTIL